ncbi:elongation factor P [Candidatus Giovannonibacteria bacterium]|nr:elongation factor P [Candidatus Giovannonibacteria bacterium]
MLSYTDLTPGTQFILDGEPYEVLDYQFIRMQQRKPSVQTKIKNLISGKIVAKTFQPSDVVKEADIERETIKFIYAHRGEYIFQKPDNPKERFSLLESLLGNSAKYLKPDLEVTAYKFNEKIINIELPVKIDYKVKDAPPGFKGDTATGGNKLVTLENDLQINVPLFIETGDVVRINTESGEYTERINKA